MITIRKDPKADSRAAGNDVTIYELEDATAAHIADVQQGLLYFAEKLNDAGWNHDWTKKAYLEEFHKEFTTLEPGEGFKKGKWYALHVDSERHHLLTKAPTDVNLLDVLEYIVDGVMAGMARSGSVYPITLPDDILQKAMTNTVEMLKAQVELEVPNG